MATTRPIAVKLRLSEAERSLIAEKMKAANIRNREAYLRKMAMDGYVLRLDFADVRRMVWLLSNATNNLNQVAKRANETWSIHAADVRTLREDYEKLWGVARDVMKKLAKL